MYKHATDRAGYSKSLSVDRGDAQLPRWEQTTRLADDKKKSGQRPTADDPRPEDLRGMILNHGEILLSKASFGTLPAKGTVPQSNSKVKGGARKNLRAFDYIS